MLSIKSQKIIPIVADQSEALSFAVTADNYFGVFSLEYQESVNTQVIKNIITDILAHSLVFTEAESGLSVLEKSLKECREAVEKIKPGVFNGVVVFFDADIVYVSIYGDAKALYLDGTQVVHVDTDKEGRFAGGTQKIDTDKVLVLCTRQFFERFPPQSLVSLDKPILAQDLEDLASAVILKVDRVNEEKVLVKPKEKPTNEEKLSDYNLGEKSNRLKKFDYNVKTSLNSRSLNNVEATVFGVAASSVLGKKFGKFFKVAVMVIGAVGLVAGGYFVFRVSLLKPKTSKSQVTLPDNQISNNQEDDATKPDISLQNPQDKEVQGELSKKLDEANRVRRVKPQIFYDISIADAKANPTELAQGQNYLAVSDSTQGKIYISAKDVTKFEELPQIFPGVKNLSFNGDTLVFTDDEGVKFYAIATKSVNKSYLTDDNYGGLGPSREYLGFTYAVIGDILVKFTKTGNKLVGALWAQRPEFSKVVSMDIDGNIYVLFNNGSLEKYTAGEKGDFSIVGLDKPVQEPLKVVAKDNFQKIYVADGAEGRIIAFDEDGVLDFQLKPELGNEWADLKSFDISADEKTFYILSGTKVFEFKL